jgi:hypothetical protein
VGAAHSVPFRSRETVTRTTHEPTPNLAAADGADVRNASDGEDPGLDEALSSVLCPRPLANCDDLLKKWSDGAVAVTHSGGPVAFAPKLTLHCSVFAAVITSL